MLRRGLNGYAYCDNDLAKQTDPTGEVANVLLGGIAGGIIGGAFGFAGSALSQLAEGKGFNARKAWGAAANGAIVGAARGALIASGAGIPLAFGVDFAAGMAGSLAEQKITGARIAPVRAAVDGVFNAAGGRLYGTSPLKNAGNAFIRGALEGAVKGGAYNIADVLDNRLRNAYNARKRQKLRNRNTWNKKNKSPWNSRNPRPTGSRSPQSHCGRPKPLKGMRNPKRGSSKNRIYRTHIARPNDKFRFRSFVRDVVAGAVMGGLASASFYGAGKAVEALKRGIRKVDYKNTDVSISEEISYRKPQVYTPDLSHVTGKGARARNRAIEAILKEDFPDLKLTYKPKYSPFIRTGVAQKDTGTQIGKNMFSSREDLRDTIIHEELHHRWWKKGIFNHHPRNSYKEKKFYKTIAKYMRMRGWK